MESRFSRETLRFRRWLISISPLPREARSKTPSLATCQPLSRFLPTDAIRATRRIGYAISFTFNNFVARRSFRRRGPGLVLRGRRSRLPLGSLQCGSRRMRLFWSERRRNFGLVEFSWSLVCRGGYQFRVFRRRAGGWRFSNPHFVL